MPLSPAFAALYWHKTTALYGLVELSRRHFCASLKKRSIPEYSNRVNVYRADSQEGKWSKKDLTILSMAVAPPALEDPAEKTHAMTTALKSPGWDSTFQNKWYKTPDSTAWCEHRSRAALRRVYSTPSSIDGKTTVKMTKAAIARRCSD